MAEEQKTDDDSIELSTVVQLSPHVNTDQISVVARDGDGKEYISLDEAYEVTGQESLGILAANCQQYLQHRRLSQSGLTALRIDGVEGLVPGYDRFNAYKGGESFIDALKKGFITIVKAAKRFLLAVVDWIVNKIKALLGFSKTEKELKIVADVSEDLKKDLGVLLSNITGADGIDLDIEELYAALPGNVTATEAFSIIHNRNKTAMDQLETLEEIAKDLEDAENLILNSGNIARQSRSRYQQAARKLRAAFKDPETFSVADVIEFRSALDEEVGVNLNPAPLRDMLSGLIDKVYGINLGEVGLDKDFKDNLRKQRDSLTKLDSVKVTASDYEKVRRISKKMNTILLRASRDHFDPAVLDQLKDVIDVKDGELIDAIDRTFDNMGVLKMSYTSYMSSINEYSASLEHLATIAGQIRRSIAGVVNWANKVDKLMISYISQDISKMVAAEKETLNPTGLSITAINNAQGEQVDTAMFVDYDKMLIAKHPYIGSAIMAWRMNSEELRKSYKVIDRINAGLKAIGINNRI